jgi:hypothetical protein
MGSLGLLGVVLLFRFVIFIKGQETRARCGSNECNKNTTGLLVTESDYMVA